MKSKFNMRHTISGWRQCAFRSRAGILEWKAYVSSRLKTFLRWHWRLRRAAHPHKLPAEIIISLTSYAPRFATLALTLRCLLTQTVKANRLVLWISHEDFVRLPKDVTSLTAEGLEIMATENLKSYKKIIPALMRFPSAFICTADDDVYYWSTWLAELLEGAGAHDKVVRCHRAHEIRMNASGEYRPYQEWSIDVAFRGEAPFLFPTGIGGVLYPPGIFDSEVTDERAFMTLCPHGDDIWLYWMARRTGARYRTVGKHRSFVTWKGSQESALWQANMFGGRNDLQIRAMAERYGYPS